MSSSWYCIIHVLRFICCCCTLIYKVHLILLCFICNHHKTMLISELLNEFLCDLFEENYLLQTSTSTTFQKCQSPTQSKYWKTEPYRGSDDCGEGHHDSVLNRLTSVILRQYTTLTNQCSQILGTWKLYIQYCEIWYHSKKRPGRV